MNWLKVGNVEYPVTKVSSQQGQGTLHSEHSNCSHSPEEPCINTMVLVFNNGMTFFAIGSKVSW